MIIGFLKYEFAGIWPMLWEFGLGGFLIILCLAAAYFSPIGKRDFLYAAAILAVVMVTFTCGVSTGEKRVQAQWDVARANQIEVGQKARAGAVRDVARKPSRWVPNRQDRYNRDGQ